MLEAMGSKFFLFSLLSFFAVFVWFVVTSSWLTSVSVSNLDDFLVMDLYDNRLKSKRDVLT